MTVTNVDSKVRQFTKETTGANAIEVENANAPILAKGDVFMFSGGGNGIYFTR